MVLTRNNEAENYYTDGCEADRTVQQMMDKVYTDAVTLNQAQWAEADTAMRFAAGDATIWNDVYGNMPAGRRKQFSFNRMMRVRNMITGYQRRNRKSIVAVPVENSDQETTDIYSSAIWWAWKRSQADEIVSACFDRGTVVTGMALSNIWMDYNTDPVNGDIRCDYVPYSSFLIDPYFSKQDLSDCSFVWRRKWLSKKELQSIFPARSKEIELMSYPGNTDGKFQFQAESYNYAMKNLHIYDEYWYRDLREQTILIDLETGECVEWRGKDEDLERFRQQYPQIIARTSLVPTVKLASVIDNRTFYHGPNPLGIDKYPFVPFLGYYNPEIPYYPYRVQGVMKGLQDAQYLYNRRRVIELDILESQVTSGFKYKVDSLVNPKDIFLSGQGKGIALKKGADMTDVEKILPPGIDPSMMQLSQMLGAEVQEIAGVSDELLGMATDDKAGILAMLRQGAGLTALQTLFDQLDFSMKLMGSLYLELIQENFGPGKIKRITGKEPTPQFYKQSFGKYDVEIEEGFNTSTQRQMQAAQLFQLQEMGFPVPPKVMVEALSIQNKSDLIKGLEEQQQKQQQMEQMQAQVQQLQMQAQMQAMEAQAQANRGLAVERLSRVQENRALAVERLSEGQRERENAKLAAAKAVKELEGMDLDQIERLYNIISLMKQNTLQRDEANFQVELDKVAQSGSTDSSGLDVSGVGEQKAPQLSNIGG